MSGLKIDNQRLADIFIRDHVVGFVHSNIFYHHATKKSGKNDDKGI